MKSAYESLSPEIIKEKITSDYCPGDFGVKGKHTSNVLNGDCDCRPRPVSEDTCEECWNYVPKPLDDENLIKCPECKQFRKVREWEVYMNYFGHNLSRVMYWKIYDKFHCPNCRGRFDACEILKYNNIPLPTNGI